MEISAEGACPCLLPPALRSGACMRIGTYTCCGQARTAKTTRTRLPAASQTRIGRSRWQSVAVDQLVPSHLFTLRLTSGAGQLTLSRISRRPHLPDLRREPRTAALRGLRVGWCWPSAGRCRPAPHLQYRAASLLGGGPEEVARDCSAAAARYRTACSTRKITSALPALLGAPGPPTNTQLLRRMHVINGIRSTITCPD